MPPPGAFTGSRKQFLRDCKPDYAAAVAAGQARDEIARIWRRYFKRYPIELAHDEEPSPEHLAAVNDDAPDRDVAPPDPEALTPNEYQRAITDYEERRRLIVFRKAQIQRRMAYQHMKDNAMDPKESGAFSPYRLLLQKLTGKGLQKPRLKTASNIWRRSYKAEIETEAKTRAGPCDPKVLHKKLASLREKVAKEMYSALSAEDKGGWENMAKEEHEEALRKWTCDVEGPLSEDPADRQRCIEQLVYFAQPILDLISEATGWKTTLLTGGPQPADDGILNVVSFHSGTTLGDTKMNFGRSEQVNYNKYLVPMFQNFLQKCYTVEECRTRALPSSGGFEGIAAVLADNNCDATVVSGGYPAATSSFVPPVQTTTTPPPAGLPTPPPTDSTPLSRPNDAPSQTPSTRPPSRQPSVGFSPAPSRAPSVTYSPPPSPSPPIVTSLPASQGGVSDKEMVAIVVDVTGPLSGMEMLPALSPPISPPNPLAATTVPVALTNANPTTPLYTSANATTPNPSTIAALVTNSSATTPRVSPKPKPTATNNKRPLSVVEEPQTKPASSKKLKVTPPPLKPTRGSSRTNAHVHGIAAVTPSAPSRSSRNRNAALPTAATKASKPDPPPSSPSTNSRPPPSWFVDSLKMFTVGTGGKTATSSTPLGQEWRSMVEDWSRFERQSRFAGGSFLISKNRPAAVGQWLKRARTPDWWPEALDLAQYETDFSRWWLAMQPVWRVKDGRVVNDSTDGQWGDLKVSGVNGVLSVVVGLFFWGLHAHNKPAYRDNWLAAVTSFHNVLRCW